MKTYLHWLLLLGSGVVVAQPKNKAFDAKASVPNNVQTTLAGSSSPGKSAGASVSATFSKTDLTLLANGYNLTDNIAPGVVPKKKDPLGTLLSGETKGGPATYGVMHNTAVVFDEWMLRMAVCIDKCETFWTAYPQCREAVTQKQAAAALGFGDNTGKAGVEIMKASPDLFSTFLFYEQYVAYYNKMNYVPLRAYAGSVEASINWLALDPYDIRIAILEKTNWSIIEAREASGMNRGNQRNTTKFIPQKK